MMAQPGTSVDDFLSCFTTQFTEAEWDTIRSRTALTPVILPTMCPCTRADVPDALSSGMSGDVVEIVRAAMLTCGWCGGFACTGSHGCQAPHVLLALGVQGSICESAAAVHVLLRLHAARPDLWFAVCLPGPWHWPGV